MKPEDVPQDNNGFRLPKRILIRKSSHYQAVYQQGKRLRGRHFSLIYRANQLGYNRLGISIHGVKRAVLRNRRKRLIRDFFRHNKNFLPPGHDIVFAARHQFQPSSPQEVKSLVDQVIRAHPPHRPVRKTES